MKQSKIEEVIFDIHGKVSRMEEHLSDMNGKLVRHDRAICDDIEPRVKKLESFSQRAAVIMNGIFFALGLFGAYLLNKLFLHIW
jgi:hypothetical protein